MTAPTQGWILSFEKGCFHLWFTQQLPKWTSLAVYISLIYPIGGFLCWLITIYSHSFKSKYGRPLVSTVESLACRLLNCSLSFSLFRSFHLWKKLSSFFLSLNSVCVYWFVVVVKLGSIPWGGIPHLSWKASFPEFSLTIYSLMAI